MLGRMAGTCSRELEVINCSLDHDYADSIVRSQWQSRSRNNYYLLYRWLVAIFVTFVVLYSFIENATHRSVGYFFIYFTHWGIMINMVVGLMGAILVTVWHVHDDFHGNSMCDSFCIIWSGLWDDFHWILIWFESFFSFPENVLMRNDEMPRAFKVYWALHNTALITSFVVTIVYWGFLHTGKPLIDVREKNRKNSFSVNDFALFASIYSCNAVERSEYSMPCV